MKKLRAHRLGRIFQMKNLSKKSRKRRMLKAIENLENLSFNTRRFLSRPAVQKLSEDENKSRKHKKSVRHRYSGSGSASPDSVGNSSPGTEHHDEVSIIDNVSSLDADKIRKEIVRVLLSGEKHVNNVVDSGRSIVPEHENPDETRDEQPKSEEQISVSPNEDENEAESSVPANSLELVVSNTDELTTENEEKSEHESTHRDSIGCEVPITEELITASPPKVESRSEDESIDPEHGVHKKSIERVSPYTCRIHPKCKYCRETHTVTYSGPPTDSITEDEILKLKALKLSQDDEKDDTPQYRLTRFSVFDKANHLCSLDGDLIQNSVQLFFSGYVKQITNDDPSTEDGYPGKKMGPITEWWITGLDGATESENVVMGFSSDRADYYLLQPNNEYVPFLESLTEKTRVARMVFRFLLTNSSDEDKTYEELLMHLESQSVDEETLLKFANFIYEQVFSYDTEADEDEVHLLDWQCMRELAQIAKIEPIKKVRRTRVPRRALRYVRKDPNNVKAVITPLVESIFSTIFRDQMDENKDKVKSKSKTECFVQLPRLKNPERYAGFWKCKNSPKVVEDPNIVRLEQDALSNNVIKPFSIRVESMNANLLDKYGVFFKFRQQRKAAQKRKLSKDSEEETEHVTKKIRKFRDDTVVWQSEVEEIDDRKYFTCAKVGDELVHVGNYVSMRYDRKIGLAKYMYEDSAQKTLVHVHWFCKSCDTILKESGTRKEIFMTDDCEDVNLSEVDRVLSVDQLHYSLNEWRSSYLVGDWMDANEKVPDRFFYQKRYNYKFGQFQDVPENVDLLNSCSNCSRKKELENREIPLPIGETYFDEDAGEYIIKTVRWRDENFSVGSCVFLHPGTLIVSKTVVNESRTEERYDEVMYPEKYRKKYTNDEDGREEPFDVGYITKISTKKRQVKKSKDVRIAVKKFYRPQNTHLKREEADREDLNKLYWTDKECELKFDQVEGKCFVSYANNLTTTVEEWSDRGPYRFYFTQAYDTRSKRFTEPPSAAKNVGKLEEDVDNANVPTDWPVVEPLATMDVFAGCGGLSDGLHQSGVADCRWAIEKFHAPAQAFQLNNPNAKVFEADCNELMRNILNPRGKKQTLPKKGEVDLLCGGPPCQGFSRMNRFKQGQYSQFKNSLVPAYLSYCDYFRPRFFVLENVRDFVSTNRCKVFQLTMSCLLRMGYQVGFSVLQCGKYGIPQSRRRTIILAAAPGEILPRFPEPTHTFPLNSFLDVTIDNDRYKTDIKWTKSAPYRTITVGDAISDLPKIENNHTNTKMTYKKEPQTQFQKMMRGIKSGPKDELYEHECKKLAPLILKRISYIPCEPPGDWRDLPNIEVTLSDGTRTSKLVYAFNDHKNPKTKKGQLHGVCACATSPKARCSPGSKQKDTLIPWCLPHTSNRHNQWSGLYGRVPNDSYFRTVVTNPEPMGKQGRVLHPDQNRVVSVRECARSQGFRDSFEFYGDILDKYAQIGNAVAPPLGKAIGLEIRKSIAAKIVKDRGM